MMEKPPRMRTLDKTIEYLHQADEGCELTKCALRRLVITGRVPSVKIGAKYLLNLDMVERYLRGEML